MTDDHEKENGDETNGEGGNKASDNEGDQEEDGQRCIDKGKRRLPNDNI